MKIKSILLFLLISFAISETFAQKLKVACIGNSITAGYLLKNPEKEAYPSQLQALLGDKYEVGNFGLSGATLLKKGHRPYNKTKQFQEALAFKADIAIIHLGLNDTDPRNWPNYKTEFEADYNWLMDTLKKDNPKLKILVCKLSPIFSGHPRFLSGTRDWYWQIQSKIENIAKANNLEVIDLNKALNNRSDLFGDNLHPSTEGAGIIAKTVYQHLTGNYEGLKVSPLFADHMVLQRDKPIAIFGTANKGESVLAKFNNTLKSVIADDNGNWEINFPAMKFGGPYEINVSSKDKKVKFSDVLIGDVWLCSGQSNMAFTLKSSATGKETLANLKGKKNLRLLKFNTAVETDNQAWDSVKLDQVNKLNYFSGTWQTTSALSASDFSAVAYYFGEKLEQDINIPIGLVEMAVGGSTLESWLDRRTLEDDNLLVNVLSNWRKSDFMQDWVRERADVNLKNSSNPRQRHPYEPAYNYESGISKLVQFPIKGVIWYQGESNAQNVELFKHEFPVLVNSWRKKWGYQFPFYYVQLSAIDRAPWPYFREAQSDLEKQIPNVGMAVSSDLGDSLNVHPIFKKEIGNRLALLALKNTYQKNVVAKGPSILTVQQSNNKIILTFSNAIKLKIAKGDKLLGFEFITDKGARMLADAQILGNEVYLKTANGLKIKQVLYAYQPFTRANLSNEAGLPASTFSIEIK